VLPAACGERVTLPNLRIWSFVMTISFHKLVLDNQIDHQGIVASINDDRITTVADPIVEMRQATPPRPQRVLEGPHLLDVTHPAPIHLGIRYRAWFNWRG
jgi:hypothetical protein